MFARMPTMLQLLNDIRTEMSVTTDHQYRGVVMGKGIALLAVHDEMNDNRLSLLVRSLTRHMMYCEQRDIQDELVRKADAERAIRDEQSRYEASARDLKLHWGQ